MEDGVEIPQEAMDEMEVGGCPEDFEDDGGYDNIDDEDDDGRTPRGRGFR